MTETEAGENELGGGWRPLAEPPKPSLRQRLGGRRPKVGSAKNAVSGALSGAGGPVGTSGPGGPGATTAMGPRGSGAGAGGRGTIGAFVRLARTHALHAAGDASYAVALVGSIFALDTDAARGRILLYLLLTLAPFALVGPFIGPALDRIKGGRRLMIVVTLLVRAVLMLLLIRNLESLWLFPIAFSQLVMSKTYSVAKAATVPTTVSDEGELVAKNSRLAVLGTVAGGVGAAPALALQWLWGSPVALGYAMLVYIVGVVAGSRLPRGAADHHDEPDHEIDLRSAGIRLAASAMSVMRGISGFVFWLMVFAYGSNDLDVDGLGKAAGVAVRNALGFSIEGDNSQPAWKLGLVLASIGLGILLGNILAPRLRERFSEEHMIIGALGAVVASAAAAVWAGGLSGAWLVALIVGAAPASAKLAFDSLVQRDAPGGNQGAAFARFETRFQIASVIGSVVAVAPTVVIPIRIGSLIVAAAAGVAATMYYIGSRRIAQGEADIETGLRDAAGWLRSLGRQNNNDDQGAPGGSRGPGAGPGPGQWAAPPTVPVSVVTPEGPPAGAPARPASPSPPVPPAPTASGADPFGDAFAAQRLEPSDWAAPAFEEPATDSLLPPQWLDGHRAAERQDRTPPYGTDRVDLTKPSDLSDLSDLRDPMDPTDLG